MCDFDFIGFNFMIIFRYFNCYNQLHLSLHHVILNTKILRSICKTDLKLSQVTLGLNMVYIT